MNIETTKLELIQQLLQTQKVSLLSKIKKVFEEEQVDWWHDLNDDEKNEIKIGISQADKGEFSNHDVVMKKFDKWH